MVIVRSFSDEAVAEAKRRLGDPQDVILFDQTGQVISKLRGLGEVARLYAARTL